MGRKRQEKPPIVPAQDKKICGLICLCQLTIVLSCVALVYLTVAVYLPSHRAFSYGIESVPVMCQTVNTSLGNNCEWTSCGEWCLTKSSGFCPQINVTARRNGTTLALQGCNRFTTFACPKANMEGLPKYNCNNDTECTSLKGVFNCRLGHCANVSSLFLCRNRVDGPLVDAHKENLKLNGFFECHNSKCRRVKSLQCDRVCMLINTVGWNVYVQFGDSIVTGQCEKAVAYTEARGSEEGLKIPRPRTVWSEQDGILFTSCFTYSQMPNRLEADDCINGTLAQASDIPSPTMNFTTFWSIVEKTKKVVDPEQKYLPMQGELTIYNVSKLYINLEGCVNTLRGECAEFLSTHGNDGDNQTAQSRFPCFYKKNDSTLVITRFDLRRTWRDLMVAIFVPSTLFVVSFITLVVIGHSVKVGDDAKMRCSLCPNKKKKTKKTREEINAEVDLVMDGIIERTNAMVDLEARANTSAT